MKKERFKKKTKEIRESPLLAAFAALLLVIISITLAVSCGGEKGTTESDQKTATRTAPGRTTTQAGTSQPTTMSTTPSASVSTKSNSTIWSSVFTRKDPFKQQVQTGMGGTTTTPSSGTTTTPSYTGEIPYYGSNGANGTTGGTTGGTGYTPPSTGGTGYTYPPPVK